MKEAARASQDRREKVKKAREARTATLAAGTASQERHRGA
jgi:hypothetical protein